MTIASSLTASIALFNSADKIKRAISSIKYQTWKGPLEILVIDDCSTDGSADIVEKLRKKDERIRLIKLEKNVGLGAVRNIQIQEAKGEYLAFLDADDEWMPEKVEKQFKILQEAYRDENSDNILCSVNLLYVNPETGKSHKAIQPDEPYEKRDILLWGANRPTPVIAACLGKTKTYLNAGPFDENLRKTQDWDFSIRFYCANGRFCFVRGEPLYKYFFSGANRNPVDIENSIRYLFNKHKQLFIENDLYTEQLARMLYYFVSEIYEQNGRIFEGITKKHEAAILCPNLYGNNFLDYTIRVINKRIVEEKYETRIDRKIMHGIKKYFSR